MIDNEKLVALIRLRDLLYSGVRPTLRECGFSAETIQGLVKEQLVKSGDQKPGNYTDRCVIEEILPAGYSFIAQQHALRDQHNVNQLSYAEAG
jgi:hypothetical protein